MRLGVAGIIAVAIPALEIVGIYLVGSRIGFAWTLLWLLAGIIVGAVVIRQEQTSFSPRLLQAIQQGQAPFALLWASGRRFLAGLLLIIPGPFSDFLALLLLLWPRPKLAPVNSASAHSARVDPDKTDPDEMGPRRPERKSGATTGDVIEGEFRREE